MYDRDTCLHDKTSRIQQYSDTKNSIRQILDSKISGDTTKPGRFYFGFAHLCVNGKTNPALKHLILSIVNVVLYQIRTKVEKRLKAV